MQPVQIADVENKQWSNKHSMKAVEKAEHI
jgi:hypothetical protein